MVFGCAKAAVLQSPLVDGRWRSGSVRPTCLLAGSANAGWPVRLRVLKGTLAVAYGLQHVWAPPRPARHWHQVPDPSATQADGSTVVQIVVDCRQLSDSNSLSLSALMRPTPDWPPPEDINP
jgi:hypothetical protein